VASVTPMGTSDERAVAAPDLRRGARLLVDAMNVVGSRPDGWWRDRDAAVARLAERLRRLAVGTGAEVVLVTETEPRRAAPPEVGAVITPGGAVRMMAATAGGHATADDAIVALLEDDAIDDAATSAVPDEPAPGDAPATVTLTLVVTADRALRRRVTALGAQVVGPRWLLEQLDLVADVRAAASRTGVLVEPVEVDRWRQARALRLAALLDTPDAFGGTYDEEAAFADDRWRRRLTDPAATTFVAELPASGGQRVGVGMAVVGPPYEHEGARGLYGVWVAPWARGSGAGDALLSAAADHARAAGACHLLLDVGDHNDPAAGLYARAGFVATGRRGSLPPPREHVTEHELALPLGGPCRSRWAT
jgi:ribosomal protein S18 acetylase RimI-like enzyme